MLFQELLERREVRPLWRDIMPLRIYRLKLTCLLMQAIINMQWRFTI